MSAANVSTNQQVTEKTDITEHKSLDAVHLATPANPDLIQVDLFALSRNQINTMPAFALTGSI